jgi:hypothetical protein
MKYDTQCNGTQCRQVTLNVVYAEFHLCKALFMLSVIYAECHLC